MGHQPGIGNVYDFENHLVQHGAITIVYDGDGNRVSKTAGGTTTKYLVDTNSVTGYAQVLEELQSGTVTRKYTYGLSLISENQTIGSTQTVSFYGFDGHGSVRQLTDRFANVTDTYTYDAFGTILTTTGSTPNNFKFAGEQFDPDLGLYYNRARYLDVRQGRFWGMDAFEGLDGTPESLHRYLYVMNNPVMLLDPTGLVYKIGDAEFGYAVEDEVEPQYAASHQSAVGGLVIPDLVSYGKWCRLGEFMRCAPYALKPDILNFSRQQWLEIKPLTPSGIGRAVVAWGLYSAELGDFGFRPDVLWIPPAQPFPVYGQQVYVINLLGILFYTDDYQKVQNAQTVLVGATSVTAAYLLLSALKDYLGGISIETISAIPAFTEAEVGATALTAVID